MELELNRTHLIGYETLLDTTVYQEETLETIVPDACPDILRLVDTQGKILLKSKSAMDGRVALTGTALLTVLYQPEGGNGLCCLDVSIPVQIAAEGKNVSSGCLVVASPRIIGADTRTINPRKILTRVEIAADVKAFTNGSTALCTGIGAAEGAVEQLTERCRFFCISAVQEKQITFEDDLTIPVGHPAAEELICSRAALSCRESKIIGNKLILKGEAVVQLLYRAAGGDLDAADFTLPFSQIMEVAGVGEDASGCIEMSLSGAEFVLGGDGRTVSASLSMLAQAVVREERELTLLVDAYSTDCMIQTEQTPFAYLTRQAEGVGRQSVRETVETGIQVRSVVEAYGTVGRITQQWEGSELVLTAQVCAAAVCMSEDGEYFAASRSLDVSCPVELPEGCGCEFSCRLDNVTASPTADGVEVRFALEFPFLCLRNGQKIVLRDAAVAPEEKDARQRPSIVLRVLNGGERLWDVAKHYRTTTGDIVRVNELDSEQPADGTLLLIPRKR